MAPVYITYLECPCCGEEGAMSSPDGRFEDEQPLICGCPGHVSINDDGETWIDNGEGFCAHCQHQVDHDPHCSCNDCMHALISAQEDEP